MKYSGSSVLLLFLAGCPNPPIEPPPGPPVIDAELTVSPPEGSSYGNYLVEITADKPIFENITPEDFRVTLGENALIFVNKVDDTRIIGVAQGHPAPSNENVDPFDVDIQVETPEGIATTVNGFRYLPPVSPVFNNVYTIGASFSAGTQSNSINVEGQLHGPVALAIEQLQAYFGNPLATEPGLPHKPLLTEINRASGLVEVDSGAALNEIITLVNAGGGTFSKVRIDPKLKAHNLSIPGSGARHMVDGTNGPDDIGFTIFSVFNQQPEVDVFSAIGDPVDEGVLPPIEVIEANQPTAVFSSIDFFGNDVLGGDDLPTSEIKADLLEMFQRVGAIPSRPAFFALTLLDVNVVPGDAFGQDERYEVLRTNAAMVEAANQVNEELAAQGLAPRIFIGDFFSPFFELVEANPNTAIDINGLQGTIVTGDNGENDLLVVDADGDTQRIGLDLFEGLISLDGLHLTNTGYAVIANGLIDLVNRSIGPNAVDPRNRLMAVEMPFIDIAQILANDPLAPKNLEAERLAVNAAEPDNQIASFDTFADVDAIPPLEFWDRCAILGIDLTGLDCPVTLTMDAPATVTAGQSVEVSVTVLNENGVRIRNVPVAFFIDREDDATGRLNEDARKARTLTDNNGVARATFTGGTNVGTTVIQTQAGGVLSSITVQLN
jgi:lysophospholipase L1-like esterase